MTVVVTETHERRRYAVRGIVQGVGFRPFVVRLARIHGVSGFVMNDVRGVEIEIEGTAEQLDRLIVEVQTEAPPLAEITDVVLLGREVGPARHADFTIARSDSGGQREVVVTPDAFVCEDCLRELFDPNDRRYGYPFINCTRCGPRFSIVRDIPYDRAVTTMSSFVMCPECEREYGDPLDRRFHAQPNACWTCGPQARLLARDGTPIATTDPLHECARLLSEGAVVGVKGIGGYHVMCDAACGTALLAIRERKHRPHKPFALMSASLDDVRTYARVDESEAELLSSTARPIVLLRRREPPAFPDLVAPGVGDYGVMLAYTPLHYLLLRRGNFRALVATSGNVTDEPIVHRDEALPEQLGQVVDYFLTHDREIHTRIDDSIVRSVRVGEASTTSVIRRARGFTPKPLLFMRELPCVLAVGGELKNTICVTKGRQLVLSQHIGDLSNLHNYEFFVETCERLPRLLGVRPDVIACDMHPDFLATRFAGALADVRVVPVQHHHAHIAACAGEHQIEGPVIGVAFDGMGYGADGTAWGGEFLLASYAGFERVGHLRPFGLPGGDKAVREPFRVAYAVLVDTFGAEVVETLDLPIVQRIDPQTRRVLRSMIEHGLNVPQTSSIGRLFDAVAALLDVRDVATYEGQAAIELEQLARGFPDAEALPFAVEVGPGGMVIDVRPMIRALVELRDHAPRGRLAASFHATLAAIVRDVCVALARDTGVRTVALSGGVFQNCELVVRCHRLLERERLRVLRHQRVPTNDGGLSFGQALVAAATLG